MAKVLFVLGNAGSGKTHFSRKFIKSELEQKNFWCLVDKDHVGEPITNQLMIKLGLDPDDRDSPIYKEEVRYLEYQAALSVIRDQLHLGINVVAPGPWTKELKNGLLFNNEELGFPKETELHHVYLDAKPLDVYNLIKKRNNKRDKWKLNHWEDFAKKLEKPQEIVHHNILTLTHGLHFEKQKELVKAMM